MENVIIKAVLAYVEKHPEVIEAVVEKLVAALLDHLSKKQDPKA